MNLKWHKLTENSKMITGAMYLMQDRHETVWYGEYGEDDEVKYLAVEGMPAQDITCEEFQYYALVLPVKCCANCAYYGHNIVNETPEPTESVCEYHTDSDNVYCVNQCHCCDDWELNEEE